MEDDFKMKKEFQPKEDLGDSTGASAPVQTEEKPLSEHPANQEKETIEETPKGEQKPLDEEDKPAGEQKPSTEEAPVVDESSNTEEKPTGDEKPPEKEVQAEEPNRSLNNISELTENQFETQEELYEAYQGLNNKVDGKTLMENINSQIQEEYGDENITYADLVSAKSVDFENMGSLDLIKEYLEFEDPDITDKDIRSELREFDLMRQSNESIQERIDDPEDSLTQDKYDDIEAKMDRRARKARKELMEYQDSIDLESFEINVPGLSNIDKSQQKSPEEVQQEIAEYNSVVETFKDFEVEVGSEENPFKVNIKVSEEDRNGIREFCEPKDGKSFVDNRWLDQTGKVNMGLLMQDVHKIQNYERDLKVAYSTGKSEGLKAGIKENDNIDLKSKGDGVTPSKASNNVHANISREIN